MHNHSEIGPKRFRKAELIKVEKKLNKLWSQKYSGKASVKWVTKIRIEKLKPLFLLALKSLPALHLTKPINPIAWQKLARSL
ncbi:MAG: hypothetical protein C5B52_18630 [Bacteroidetes bacterium]|nr:MAG: hypothetical protein C5B52_18630 [Bacteroidota bacterium]